MIDVSPGLDRPTTVSTRLLTLDDVAAVHAIDQDSYVDPWPAAHIATEVDRADRCHVVAIAGNPTAKGDETVVGHASLLVVEPEATLTTIAVAVDQRGSGVATQLLLDLFGRAIARGVESITLEVRSQNRAAHGLYRRFGFAPASVRRNYYPAVGTTPADDALIMWANDVHRADYQNRLVAIADTASQQRTSP